MDKPVLTKGYVLTETLIALLILGLLTEINLHFKMDSIHKKISIYQYQIEIASLHHQSLINRKKQCLEEFPQVCFNQNGNINQATTIHYLKHDIVFHLGFGHHEIK